MAQRVVVMDADEYDDVLNGLEGLPFDIDRRVASNGKYVRTIITINKRELEDALKAREFDLVKPEDGSDINFSATINWND